MVKAQALAQNTHTGHAAPACAVTRILLCSNKLGIGVPQIAATLPNACANTRQFQQERCTLPLCFRPVPFFGARKRNFKPDALDVEAEQDAVSVLHNIVFPLGPREALLLGCLLAPRSDHQRALSISLNGLHMLFNTHGRDALAPIKLL
eukprot:3744654-Rhodomonas_salina.2